MGLQSKMNVTASVLKKTQLRGFWGLLMLGLVVVVAASSCGAQKKESPQIFFGECRLNFASIQPADAHIVLDGVHLHHTGVYEVPCGEKWVLLTRKGYIPYETRFDLKKGVVHELNIEMQRQGPVENMALSKKLIETKIYGDEKRWHVASTLAGAKAEGEVQGLDDGDPFTVDYWK